MQKGLSPKLQKQSFEQIRAIFGDYEGRTFLEALTARFVIPRGTIYRTDILEAAHYTLRAVILLKPDASATPIGYSEIVFTIDTVLAPILIGLFALAIRRRLKR